MPNVLKSLSSVLLMYSCCNFQPVWYKQYYVKTLWDSVTIKDSDQCACLFIVIRAINISSLESLRLIEASCGHAKALITDCPNRQANLA